MWRHYLLGRKFILMIDHGGLKYLFEQPKLLFGKPDGCKNSMNFISRSNKLREMRIE